MTRRSTVRPNRGLGFTLIEMLVVLGIIALLVAILVPVLNRLRRTAAAQQTREEITRIEDAVNRYYDDWKAFPGPFANDDVIYNQWDGTVDDMNGGGTSTLGNGAGQGARGTHPWPCAMGTNTPISWVTMTENLVLGICGGLVWQNNSSSNPDLNVVYDAASAYGGKGAMNLNASNPHRIAAYMQVRFDELTGGWNSQYPNAGFTTGKWVDHYFAPGFIDGQYQCHNSIIPEFLDHFGEDSMPILYLRARPGARGICSEFNYDKDTELTMEGTPPYGGGLTKYQYDIGQVWDYIHSPYSSGQDLCQSGMINKFAVYHNLSTGVTIAAAQGLSQPGMSDPTNLLLGEIWDKGPNDPSQPYPNYYLPYFRDMTTSAFPNWFPWTAITFNLGGTPKNKDRYMLISAGEDRMYGTIDDMTNFQLNQPTH